jgi:hypothetical protein
MKRFLWIGLVAAVAAIIVAVSCSKKSTSSGESGGGGAQWTVMVYGAGNNNLDGADNNTSYIIQDAQDMEKVGSQGGLNIIAMISSLRLAGGAKYYKLEYHANEPPDMISSTILQNKGSKDMSDGATLQEFLTYCKTNYPASHYLLVIDDHGAGWPGSCSDDLGGAGSLLTMREMRDAIANSDIHHVDIVTFHACLMAMVEVGYELRNVASYMTACQFTMPMENVLGADLWLAWMRDNMSATPAAVAQTIAEKVIERAQFKQKTTTYAMIDLSKMTDLGARIGNFGNTLATEGAAHWNEVQDAWSQTHTTNYDDPAYVDLREFANLIKQEPNLQQNNLIRSGADSIISGTNAAVPFKNSYFLNPPDAPVPRDGLNIHFPYTFDQFDSANYVALDFGQNHWQNFLSTFLRSTGGEPPPGECPTQCAQAAVYTVGQTISQCQFTAQATQHWFQTTLGVGTFRFQLGNFPQGADYDCYTFLQCADFPNTPTGCSSEEVGPEDFTCTVTGSAVNIYILINAYQGPYGGYTFSITQTGFGPDEGTAKIVAQ